MTTQDKLISLKLSLIELPKVFQIATQVCKIPSASHQHFYEIKKRHGQRNIEELKKKARCQPFLNWNY